MPVKRLESVVASRTVIAPSDEPRSTACFEPHLIRFTYFESIPRFRYLPEPIESSAANLDIRDVAVNTEWNNLIL